MSLLHIPALILLSRLELGLGSGWGGLFVLLLAAGPYVATYVLPRLRFSGG